MRIGGTAWVAAAVMWATPIAASADDWQLVSTGRITVKTRAISGSIKEVWAEGTMDASAIDIQNTILDAESYPRFMPYVKESRFLGNPEPDGQRFVYTRLDLPIVSPRDYVLLVGVDSKVDEAGQGTFVNRWKASANRLPERANITRLKTCEGSWEVKQIGDGKSQVVYRAVVDPGGWIPSFAADAANKQGVSETWSAVEKESQRRGEARVAATAAKLKEQQRSEQQHPALTPPGA